MPFGEAETLRASISPWIWFLVVSQVLRFPLGYYTNIHIAATPQVIEDTSTDCLSYKLYSLLPLEDKRNSLVQRCYFLENKNKDFDLQIQLKTAHMKILISPQ